MIVMGDWGHVNRIFHPNISRKSVEGHIISLIDLTGTGTACV